MLASGRKSIKDMAGNNGHAPVRGAPNDESLHFPGSFPIFPARVQSLLCPMPESMQSELCTPEFA
jgi:hypothetical protein